MKVRVEKQFVLLAWFALISETAWCDENIMPNQDVNNILKIDDLDEMINRAIERLGKEIYGNPNKESGRKVAGWTPGSNTNPDEMGDYVEGDILIVLPPGNTTKEAESRTVIVDTKRRWDKGIVPYEISSDFSAEDKKTLKKAFGMYHSKTCIRFVPRTEKHNDYVFIDNQDTGCFSAIGRQGGRQVLNLQTPSCLHEIGTALHEMMHALGFIHEHNREDRDNYVTIFWNNIQRKHVRNFIKAPDGTTNTLGEKYDYGSLMHYSSHAFSKNEEQTIEPKLSSAEIGQRKDFSEADLRKLKKLYKC